MDSLKLNAMEVILSSYDNNNAFKEKLGNLKNKLKAIADDHEKRATEIFENKMKYSPEGILDQRHTLDAAIRSRVEELVDGAGFKKAIAETEKELIVPKPETETGELVQLMKEVEIRKAMVAAGEKNFKSMFMAQIIDGDPSVIAAIENSPFNLFCDIDAGVLELGKRRRLEILNPIASERLKGLKTAQADFEGMAQQAMPFDSKRDAIKDIAEGGTEQ